MIWVAWPSLVKRDAAASAAVFQGLATILLVGVTFGYARSTRAMADHQAAVDDRNFWAVESRAITTAQALLDPIAGQTVSVTLRHFGWLETHGNAPIDSETFYRRLRESNLTLDPFANLVGTGQQLMVVSKDMGSELRDAVHSAGRYMKSLAGLLSLLRLVEGIVREVNENGQGTLDVESPWQRGYLAGVDPYDSGHDAARVRVALESGEYARDLAGRVEVAGRALDSALVAP
jgi:hypothetical protein